MRTIILDATGAGFASGSYDYDHTLADNEVEASDAQAADPRGWKLVGGALVAAAPALDALKAAQVVTLRAACASAITTTGFASSALGALHGYPSDMTSQINLLGSVSASQLPNLPTDWTTPFWCADTSEAWTFAAHTAAQIQQVGTDAKAAVVAAQQKLATLTAQVAAATTADAVRAVAWG